MTVAAERSELVGQQTPRIAPPRPATTRVDDLKWEAEACGIEFIPAQETAGIYLTATGPNGWLYPEVAIIQSRRNGKTEMLVPRIRMDLRDGRSILHTAQNRTLPRRVFMRVARSLDRDEVQSIRYANGQEQITMKNGGEYMIVAPQRGARGLGADTLIFDEIREFEDEDIMAAAAPTVASSPDPQIIYLSNAGSHRSVILNDLKRRGEQGDPGLAYLEWSAAPEWSIDDRRGWAEANPALGYFLQRGGARDGVPNVSRRNDSRRSTFAAGSIRCCRRSCPKRRGCNAKRRSPRSRPGRSWACRCTRPARAHRPCWRGS